MIKILKEILGRDGKCEKKRTFKRFKLTLFRITLFCVQVVETASDDSFSDEDSPKKRNILTRRPSYRKILNDLGGGEITGKTMFFFKTIAFETKLTFCATGVSEFNLL